MKNLLKQQVKARLTDRQQKKYYKLLEKMTVTYDAWIKKAEKDLEETEENRREVSLKRVPYEVCRDYVTGSALQDETAEIILFAASDGKIGRYAENLVAQCFVANPEMQLLYGDEDVMSPEGIRYTPWLKPAWSPHTFLANFYFGSIFAVRTKALCNLSDAQKTWIWKDKRTEVCEEIYRLCYVIAQNSGGFQKREGTDFLSFPIGHVDEILFHARANKEQEMMVISLKSEEILAGSREIFKEIRNEKAPQGNGRISIIVLSKDNPEILKGCINAIKAEAGKQNQSHMPEYEIIVVDNGSSEEVKKELTGWLAENNARYIYEKMPFNFSLMCNKGVEAATGNVLLFMNDDVEVISREGTGEGFLEKMYREAVKPYTGAVGAKLYYPQSIRIQHGGIVNQQLGPVHKLQFKDDDIAYYYGFNRGKRNVIAVTGACLAVEKDKFVEAGGFPEELPVAFNDVDLCFSLFEKGYYNVVLQETLLYHHESMSRGNDDHREKLRRLLEEKDRLYKRHPMLYGKDPFYHKYFAAEILSTGFELKSDFAGAEEINRHYGGGNKVKEDKGRLANARQDKCVIISMEYAGQEENGYLMQGYAFVAGSDNACYEKYLILEQESQNKEQAGTGGIFILKPEILPRRDVESNLPDQVNVGLTGFRAHIKKENVPAGTYRIGILVKDKCTGAKIYSWTNRYLEVETKQEI